MAKIMTPNPNLTFTVTPKVIPENGTAYVLTDSEGFHCGFYGSEKDAKKAIPKIANNLSHGNCKPFKYKRNFHKR